MPFDHGAEAVGVGVGVDLGGLDVGVSHGGGDGEYILGAFVGEGAVGVAQQVGAEIDTGDVFEAVAEFADTGFADRTAGEQAGEEEEAVFAAGVTAVGVLREEEMQARVDGHDAVATAFAVEDKDFPFV